MSSDFHFSKLLNVQEIANYQQIQRAKGKAPRSLTTEINSIAKFCSFLGHADLFKVKQDEMQAYVEFLKAENLSANYIRTLIFNLNSFYMEAVKQDWTTLNPMRGITPPKHREEVPLVLTIVEMKKLLAQPDLNTVEGFRNKVMMELAYSCALRCSELVAIKLEQLDEDFTHLRVQGKGGREANLPITRLAHYHLQYYLENIWPKINTRGLPYIFLNLMRRCRMVPRIVGDITKRYGQQAGIEKPISSHIFRFSIATHLAESGADLRYIQEFLRHNSLQATIRYVQLGFKKLQEVHKQTHPNG